MLRFLLLLALLFNAPAFASESCKLDALAVDHFFADLASDRQKAADALFQKPEDLIPSLSPASVARIPIPASTKAALVEKGYDFVADLPSGGFLSAGVFRKNGKLVVVRVPLEGSESALHEDRILQTLAEGTPISGVVPGRKFRLDGEQERGIRYAIESEFIPIRPGSEDPAPTLRQRLSQGYFRGPEGEARKEKAIETLLDTFADVHSKDVVHHDVSGSNILIPDSGESRIIDWNLGGFKDDFTVAIGTIPYVPAENTFFASNRGHSPVDDLYSLRIAVWEIRAGMTLREYYSGHRETDGPKLALRKFLQKEKLREEPEIGTSYETSKMSPEERQVAMVEFSLLPNDARAWKKLRKRAQTTPVKEFEIEYGLELAHLDDAVLAQELLRSKYSSERFDSENGYRFSPERLDKVALAAYQIFETSTVSVDRSAALGAYDPTHALEFDTFFKQVRSLHEAGRISEPVYEATAGKYFRSEDESQVAK